jgi:hypothetical protein
MPSQLYTAAGTFTWTAPTGVTSVTAQCWGGGGGGAEASSGATGSGGGGGGGEFAQDTAGVTPTDGYTVVVGAAGTGGSGQEGSGNGANGGSGGNSTFTGDAAVVVTGHGGSGGHLNPTGGGAGTGGAAGTGSSNTIHFTGGAGGNGSAASQGGGGGSSAGGSAAGNPGGTSTGAGSVTVVQSAQGVANNSTTITIALPAATTAGNCLVAVIQSYSIAAVNQTVSGVTIGGLADNWAQLASYGTSSSWTVCSFWADPNCTSGQTSVKISCGGGSGYLAVTASVFEVSGLLPTGVLDKTTGTPNGSSQSWTSGTTSATSQSVEIAFGGVDANSGVVNTPGAPWVNLAAQTDSHGQVSVAGYQILASTGTQVYSGTLGSSAAYTAGIVTLKGAAGAGGNGAAAVALGGPGGAGGTGAGSAPLSGPGGGGGGSGSKATDGAAGYAGQVILTWASPTPSTPAVPSTPLTIPGPAASVLAAALAANGANAYDSLGAGQRRRATVATTTNYPAVPSLMTDVVFMPEFAVLDANVTVTGPILAESGVDVNTAGQGLSVAEGSNCKQGIAILAAGSAVVQNTSVTSSSRIFLTSQADGGTPGFLRVSTRTAGVSFTITSSSGSDTSTVSYQIFEPG